MMSRTEGGPSGALTSGESRRGPFDPRLLWVAGYVAGLVALMTLLFPPFGQRDLLAYWAGANRMGGGQSPYDIAGLRVTEHAAAPGYFADEQGVLLAWNPPWLLVLLQPLGWLPLSVAAVVWAMLTVALVTLTVILSVDLLHSDGARRVAPQHQVVLLGVALSFGPLLTLLQMGQITVLVVVSVLGGFWLWRRGHSTWAGVVWVFATCKPHLTVGVLVVLAVWLVRARDWRPLVGATMGIASSLLVASVLTPMWVADYVALLTNFPYQQIYHSTLVGVVQEYLGLDLSRAAVLAVVSGSAYWAWSRRPTYVYLMDAWVASSVLAPYGFSFDQVVLIPALVLGTAWALQRGGIPPRSAGWFAGVACIDLAPVVLPAFGATTYLTLAWVPSALALLYFLLVRPLLDTPGPTPENA